MEIVLQRGFYILNQVKSKLKLSKLERELTSLGHLKIQLGTLNLNLGSKNLGKPFKNCSVSNLFV